VSSFSNKSCSRNFMIDSKVISHDIFYDTSVKFFMYLPLALHRWYVWCYVHRSIQHLFTWQMFSVCAVRYNFTSRHHSQCFSLCLVTQVHTRMPLLEAVHYASTNIILPAEIQHPPCLLVLRTHATLSLFSFGRPMLWMLYFQSIQLGRSWTWSAP